MVSDFWKLKVWEWGDSRGCTFWKCQEAKRPQSSLLLVPRLVAAKRQPLHHILLGYMSVSVSKCPPFMRIGILWPIQSYWIRVHCSDLILTWTSTKSLFLNEWHSQILGVRTLNSLGQHSSTQNTLLMSKTLGNPAILFTPSSWISCWQLQLWTALKKYLSEAVNPTHSS